MATVTHAPLYHRARECMGLHFEDHPLHQIVKTIPNIRWSQTHRRWYLGLSKEAYLLKEALNGLAVLDTNLLKQYLQQRKAVQPLAQREQLALQAACPDHPGASVECRKPGGLYKTAGNDPVEGLKFQYCEKLQQ